MECEIINRVNNKEWELEILLRDYQIGREII